MRAAALARLAASWFAVLFIVAFLAAGAYVAWLVVATVLGYGPWGVVVLLGAALVVVTVLWLRARTDRDRAETLLWQASIREQEYAQQIAAYRHASDQWFERLLDTGEI